MADGAGGGSRVATTPLGRIGHYELLGELGRGGMGVVFRARDLDLDRVAALKRPGPDAALDPAIVKRFLREARAAARISHPNIVPIYEVFDHEGVPWLAMELVEGQSLRRVLETERALPLDRVLRHGVELASALRAAHHKHILHRDINPSNILITDDGRAMLTDFGLARYLAPPEDDPQAPTRSLDLTQEGKVLGTPGYMAPEQALGRPVDPRSDLFLLGLVLYEMATGVPAFAGMKREDLVDAILHRHPQAPSQVRQALPEELDRIIQRATAKNPLDRYESADALLQDLSSLQQRVVTDAALRDARTEPGRARLRITAVGLLLLVAAIVAGVALGLRVRRPEEAWAPTLRALVTWPGMESEARLSPDGRWVSFLSDRDGASQVWLVNLGGGTPRSFAPQTGAVVSHAWHADSDAMAFLVIREGSVTLRLVPAFGGPLTDSRPLPPRFADAALVSWIGDHVYLEPPRQGLWRLALGSGDLAPLIEGDLEDGFRHEFDVRRDEQAAAWCRKQGSRLSVWTSDLTGGNARRRTPDDVEACEPRWVGDRHLLFSSNRGGQHDLWRLDLESGGLRQVTFSSNVERVEDAAASGGRIVFAEILERGALWITDPVSGRQWRLTADTRDDAWPSVDASESRIVFQRSTPQVLHAVGVYDSEIVLASRRGERLEDEEVAVRDGGGPILSPDGRWIAYVRTSPERLYELWLHSLDGGERRRLAERFAVSAMHAFPVDPVRLNVRWTGAGELLYVEDLHGEVQRIRRVAPGGDPTDVAAGSPGEQIQDLHLSPDERTLAYVRTRDAGGSVVRCLSLASGTTRDSAGYDAGDQGRLVLRGWLDPDHWIALRSTVNEDWSERIEVLRATCGGTVEMVGVVPAGYSGSARVDRRTGTLYLTARDGIGGPHNLHAMRLDDGTVRRVTDNDLPGVTFSGLTLLADGRLVHARHERNHDLWIVEGAMPED
jgi:Tol biopolymer transport system component